jgi:hypothetical protein
VQRIVPMLTYEDGRTVLSEPEDAAGHRWMFGQHVSA